MTDPLGEDVSVMSDLTGTPKVTLAAITDVVEDMNEDISNEAARFLLDALAASQARLAEQEKKNASITRLRNRMSKAEAELHASQAREESLWEVITDTALNLGLTSDFQPEDVAPTALALSRSQAREEELSDQLKEARETNTRLNRRCQIAEAAAKDTIEKIERSDMSLGRALSAAGYSMAKNELAASVAREEELLAEVERLRKRAEDGWTAYRSKNLYPITELEQKLAASQAREEELRTALGRIANETDLKPTVSQQRKFALDVARRALAPSIAEPEEG